MSVLRKRTLLVAEDDASMRRFLEVILQQAGYEVIAAEDGLTAMQLAIRNDIDCVIADAVMPNLSGYDLCRLLRANGKFKNTKFIILSGLNNSTGEPIADAYLVKGEDLKDRLTTAVEALLGAAK